jgi:hypothetical protein
MDVLDHLIYNVNEIGKIPYGYKVNTRNKYIAIENSIYSPCIRWLFGDSRNKTVETITSDVKTLCLLADTISESFYFLPPYLSIDINESEYSIENKIANKKQDRKKKLQQIISTLKRAINGINNLCNTYNNDPIINSAFHPLIDIVNKTVDKCTSLLEAT